MSSKSFSWTWVGSWDSQRSAFVTMRLMKHYATCHIWCSQILTLQLLNSLFAYSCAVTQMITRQDNTVHRSFWRQQVCQLKNGITFGEVPFWKPMSYQWGEVIPWSTLLLPPMKIGAKWDFSFMSVNNDPPCEQQSLSSSTLDDFCERWAIWNRLREMLMAQERENSDRFIKSRTEMWQTCEKGASLQISYERIHALLSSLV